MRSRQRRWVCALRLHLSVAPGTRACIPQLGLYICRQKVGDKMVPSKPSFDTDRGGGGGSRAAVAYARAVGEYPLAVTEAEGMQLSSRSSTGHKGVCRVVPKKQNKTAFTARAVRVLGASAGSRLQHGHGRAEEARLLRQLSALHLPHPAFHLHSLLHAARCRALDALRRTTWGMVRTVAALLHSCH